MTVSKIFRAPHASAYGSARHIHFASPVLRERNESCISDLSAGAGVGEDEDEDELDGFPRGPCRDREKKAT